MQVDKSSVIELLKVCLPLHLAVSPAPWQYYLPHPPTITYFYIAISVVGFPLIHFLYRCFVDSLFL